MLQDLIITTLKGQGNIIRSFFWLGLWLFGLGVLLSYLMRWWPGERILTVRLTNYLMPWLLIGLVPGLIMAGMANRKWLAVTLLVPTILIGFTYVQLFFPRPSIATNNRGHLKIMSYNVWRNNKNIIAVAKVVEKVNPDILLLQELKPSRVHELLGALANLYPDTELHFAYEAQMLQAVIGRYPLVPLEALPKKGRAQKVLTKTPNGPITIFNIHAHLNGWLRRHHQIAALLAEDIAAVDGPVILGGDFNTTDQTQTYKLVSQYLHDAHWVAGYGFGFTFPSPIFRFKGKVPIPSLVRIDHIFYSDHFTPIRAGTLTESGGSDHLPVVAEFLKD